MNILQTIALDFGRDTVPVTVFAKQYDSASRYIKIVPLDQGQVYELEGGVTARLQLTKPDGHTVINDAKIIGGSIIAELTQQVLAAQGMAVAEIALYNDGAVLSTQRFYINIIKAAADNKDAVSSDEYKAFVNALSKLEKVVEAAGGIDAFNGFVQIMITPPATDPDGKSLVFRAKTPTDNLMIELGDHMTITQDDKLDANFDALKYFGTITVSNSMTGYAFTPKKAGDSLNITIGDNMEFSFNGNDITLNAKATDSIIVRDDENDKSYRAKFKLIDGKLAVEYEEINEEV